jgi:hypothetical protein
MKPPVWEHQPLTASAQTTIFSETPSHLESCGCLAVPNLAVIRTPQRERGVAMTVTNRR